MTINDEIKALSRADPTRIKVVDWEDFLVTLEPASRSTYLDADLVHSTQAGAFDAAHPSAPDQQYLSLFGTRPDRRGGGRGTVLLADNPARIDAEGAPAYLGSTNPANLDRYRSVGFVDHGESALPDGGPVVTTMWRSAHPGSGRLFRFRDAPGIIPAGWPRRIPTSSPTPRGPGRRCAVRRP